MKKLISLVIAVALVVCLLPVMASATVVTGIGLPATQTGYVGDILWLQPDYLGGDEWPADLVWTSSDPTIVTVSGDNWGCDCTLQAAGTATVTVTSGSLSASCQITAVQPDALTLDTPKSVTADGYTPYMATFTAPEAGTYTIYCSTSDGPVSGDVYLYAGYAYFYTDASGIQATAAVELAANETCTINANVYQDAAATFELLVIKTPAREGYKTSKDSITLKHMTGRPAYDEVIFLPDPITAAITDVVTWKIVDENVAVIISAWSDYCAVQSVAPGSTVLEAYIDQVLVASVPVVVKDAMADVSEIVWGVEYDLGAEDTIFTFTPTVTDTYTFQSFGDTTNSDPTLDILEPVADGFDSLYYFDDDIDTLNFKGDAELTAGKKYIIIVGNWSNEATFSFSMKGTAASTPNYNIKKVPAAPATCTVDGNIEYYKDENSGLLFANATATKLLSAEDVVVKAEGHKLDKVAEVAATAEKEGTKAHEKCSVCGALVVDGKEVKAADLVIAKLGTDGNAATGDSTLLLPFVALVVLSALGLGITAIARKRA